MRAYALCGLACLFVLCAPPIAAQTVTNDLPHVTIAAPGTVDSLGIRDVQEGPGVIEFYYQWVLADSDTLEDVEVADGTWRAWRGGRGQPPGQFKGDFTFLFQWDSISQHYTVLLYGEYDPDAIGTDSYLAFNFEDLPAYANDPKIDDKYWHGGTEYSVLGGQIKWTIQFVTE